MKIIKKLRNMSNKSKIAFSCATVALLVCVAGVVAYFVDADRAKNTLVIGGSNIEIVENFVPPEKLKPGVTFTKNVRVKNLGLSDCYVRVMAKFSDSDIGKYCEVDWNTEEWIYNKEDGYWYYPKSISKGDKTPSLLTKITLSEDIPESAIKDFNMIVYAESYQSKGFDTYEAAWANFQKNKKDELGPSVVFSILGGLSEESPAYTNNSDYTVTLSVSDNGTGVKSVTVNGVAAEQNENGEWAASVKLEKDAVNEVTVTATDNSGNVATLIKYICFDDVNPVLTVMQPESKDSENPTLTRDSNYTVSGTVADSGSGFKRVTVNGADAVMNEDGVWEKLLSLSEGETTAVKIVAYDHAENETSLTRYVVYRNAKTYTVNNHLTNATTSEDAVLTVTEDEGYHATLTADTGYILDAGDVIITMGGEDVTSAVYEDGTVSIDKITGDIIITVVATKQFAIQNELTNVTSSNSANYAKENDSYTAVLTAADGYTLSNVTVTMDGIDITSTAYADGTVSIGAVAGDVVITATAAETAE